MYELLSEVIDISASKKEKRLSFKKKDYLDDYYISILILIVAIIMIIAIFDNIMFNYSLVLITLVLIFVSIHSIHRSIKNRELITIRTGLTSEENRQIVLAISKELGVETFTNNQNLFRGVYSESFPFSQIISIFINNNEVLFNSRNACIGYNGKLGRPPYSFNASNKTYLLFKNRINETTKFKINNR